MEDSNDVDEHDEGLRLGELAVRKGYLDEVLLELALREQRDDETLGRGHRPLGQILLDRCWLSPWELQDVVVTLADLAAGVERTGDTPSEAIYLGAPDGSHDWLEPDSRSEDVFVARSYPRSVAVAHPKLRRLVAADVMDPVACTTRGALLDDALVAAFECSAEIVLVVSGGEVVGLLPIWDLCQHDRRVRVAAVLSPLVATVTESTPLDAIAGILRESDLPCVAVVAGGVPMGVVTRRHLKHAGLAGIDTDEIAYEELGVGG